MVRVLAFDVFGTLYDLASLREAVGRYVADAEGFVRLWRSKQLEYTHLPSLMGRFEDFWSITRRALYGEAARPRPKRRGGAHVGVASPTTT